MQSVEASPSHLKSQLDAHLQVFDVEAERTHVPLREHCRRNQTLYKRHGLLFRFDGYLSMQHETPYDTLRNTHC
jgi:hypothetical protein